MSDWERDIPGWWEPTEAELFNDLLGGEPELFQDPELQDIFHEALFDDDIDARSRAESYDDLIAYLWDEYGIDFEADFDWESYREWYDAA